MVGVATLLNDWDAARVTFGNTLNFDQATVGETRAEKSLWLFRVKNDEVERGFHEP